MLPAYNQDRYLLESCAYSRIYSICLFYCTFNTADFLLCACSVHMYCICSAHMYASLELSGSLTTSVHVYMSSIMVLLVAVGKTMTANAVANYLNKKVLLISLSLVIDKDLTKVCCLHAPSSLLTTLSPSTPTFMLSSFIPSSTLFSSTTSYPTHSSSLTLSPHLPQHLAFSFTFLHTAVQSGRLIGFGT